MEGDLQAMLPKGFDAMRLMSHIIIASQAQRVAAAA